MKERIIRAARRPVQISWPCSLLAALLALVAVTGASAKPNADSQNQGNRRPSGAVYTMTNATDGNAILAYHRAADGSLVPAGTFDTGGLGTGTGLGNQGGLALSDSHRWLLAVNAGSNEVSLFRVNPNGLRLTDVVASGGVMPISIAVNGNLVYVLNAGGTANVTGFEITPRGGLVALPGSTRPLSTAASGPAQVGITPDGNVLVVTEKATNLVDTFALDEDGYGTNMQTFPASGTTPFGFAFDSSGHLFVTEAFAGAPGASATTAYDVADGGALSVISASVPTHQTSACWAVVTPNDRYVYTTDAASGVISGYAIASDGSISLLNADGMAANTGAGSTPIDMAISRNGHYLYVLLGGTSAIGVYEVGADGSLTAIADGGITGLPASRNGLAAW